MCFTSSPHATRPRGFTLIELLVVIAIIAILIALLVPAVQKVRESAARTQCTNNLKQLALGCHNYQDTKKGLPPARVARDAYATWIVLIMPYIEQDPIYKLWDIRQGFSSQSAAARETTIPICFCPSRRTPTISPASQNTGPNGGKAGACGDYGCCAGSGANRNTRGANGAMITGHVLNPPPPGPQAGENGIDQPNTNPPAQPLIPIISFDSYTGLAWIPDGTSNTLMLGEKHVRIGHFGENGDGDQAYYSGWSYNSAQRVAGPNFPLARDPKDNNGNREDMFGSWHTNGQVMFAFCDGSVRGVRNSIDVTNLARPANRMDGQIITVAYLVSHRAQTSP